MPVGPLPSPGPFGRIVDVRVWPHGFSTRQTNTAAGPAGSAIVRPNLEDADWHTASAQKWGGNIVWTGSTPKHTVAFNGVRAFVAGNAVITGSAPTENARHNWLAYNGQKITTPGVCFGAGLKIYDSLPTEQTYTGTGNGTLEMQTPSTGPGALTGDYTVRCIDNVPPARFLVTGPDGQPVGVAQAGVFTATPVLFDGVIRFDLQHGLIGFQVGDQWTVTVEEAEQLIAITEGTVYAPSATVVSRRGVSAGASWTTLLTIGTGEWEAAEQFPSPHFWSINASATRAVTTRWTRGTFDAGGNEIAPALLVHREIDLDALTHSKTIETPARFGVSGSFSVTSDFVTPDTSECVVTGADVTESASNPGLSTTTVGKFFVGEVLAEMVLEGRHTHSKTASNFRPWTGDGSDGIWRSSWSSAFAYSVDLVIDVLGFSVQLFSAAGSDSGTYTFPGDPNTSTQTQAITTRQILSVTPDWQHVLLWEEVVATTNNYPDPYTEDTTTRWLFDAEVLQTSSSSSTSDSTISPQGGPVHILCDSSQLDPFAYDFPYLRRLSNDATNDSLHTSRLEINDVAGNALAAMTGTSHPLDFDNSKPTGRKAVFQTAAQDQRGNWLMLVSSPAVALHLRTGGPDSLTASQVHTLTGNPGADLWNIGAF